MVQWILVSAMIYYIGFAPWQDHEWGVGGRIVGRGRLIIDANIGDYFYCEWTHSSISTFKPNKFYVRKHAVGWYAI